MMAKLGEVCIVKSAPDVVNEDLHWLLNLDVVEQQTGRVLDYNYVPTEKLNGSIIQFGTANVLYSKLRPNLNKVVVPDRPGYATSEMLPLLPNENIVTRAYLAAFLRSDGFVSWAISKTVGAKMPRLGTKELLSKEIPLPAITEQNQITAQFAAVDNLIVANQQQLAILDDLVKSRFIELFGDPISNPRGWEVVPLCELADVRIGPFGSLLHKEDYIVGGHALVNPSHILQGKIAVDEKLTVSSTKYAELSPYHLQIGDLVMGRRGEMGRCAVVEEAGLLCGTGSLIIRTKGTVTSDYLQKIISFPSFKKSIEDMAVGQTMPNLNVPIVSNFQIIRPPMEIQAQYYQFVEQTDKLKFEHRVFQRILKNCCLGVSL